jgi:exopolyphosphatase/guanosine-5'-triphosphate,3'-diphosphate pyrophosphatase
VGSNSVKLLVADVQPDRSYQILLERSLITGLAQGLHVGASLDPASADRTLQAIAELAVLARNHGAQSIVAAGTSALRDAADSDQFVSRARATAGVEIRILSGAEEAQLGRAVALLELPEQSEYVLFFDIGGGSSELTLLCAGQVVAEKSLQLGARRATDAVGVVHPVSETTAAALTDWISQRLIEGAPRYDAAASKLSVAGLGGTASTVVRMLSAASDTQGPGPARIGLVQLHELLGQIAPMSLAELEQFPGLESARAPVIFSGISIIAGVLDHYGASAFTVIDRGLRYGLLLATLE